MHRWIRRTGLLLSLLLSLAWCLLWIRSYQTCDYIHRRGRQNFHLDSTRGTVGLVAIYLSTPPAARQPEIAFGVRYRSEPAYTPIEGPPPPGTTRHWEGFGFSFSSAIPINGGVGAPEWRAVAPHWSLVALSAMPGAVLAFGMLQRRRRCRVDGHCAGCGYDLRASVDRCPECGRATSPHNPVASLVTGESIRPNAPSAVQSPCPGVYRSELA